MLLTRPDSGGLRRRTFPRWPTHLDVRYGSGSEIVEGEGTDISEGGIGFQAEKLFPVGSEIQIKFRFDSPLAEWFETRAVVRHAANNRMGVEFLNLGDKQRVRIFETIYNDVSRRRA